MKGLLISTIVICLALSFWVRILRQENNLYLKAYDQSQRDFDTMKNLAYKGIDYAKKAQAKCFELGSKLDSCRKNQSIRSSN